MKRIKLTQGKFALVDDDKFEELNKYKWYAWYEKCTNSFYALRNTTVKKGKQTIVRMHRLVSNTTGEMVVDHEDHDTLNNQLHNLRTVTKAQNNMNVKLRSDNTSGVTGVSFIEKNSRWKARIRKNRIDIHLGYFSNKQDAIQARKAAEEKHFGEYAYKQ